VSSFLDDRCVREGGQRSAVSPLHSAYMAWCYEAGAQPLSQHEFREAMLELGFTQKRTAKGVVWEGVALKEGEATGVRPASGPASFMPPPGVAV